MVKNIFIQLKIEQRCRGRLMSFMRLALLLLSGDVDSTQLTSFSSVINLDKIDPGITSLGDLLGKEVGIQVLSSGGLGGYSAVSLRGASGDQVFIYLDGVLLNDASGGGVNLSQIPLNDVAAIEPGPASAVLLISERGGVRTEPTAALVRAWDRFRVSGSLDHLIIELRTTMIFWLWASISAVIMISNF